MLGAEKPSQVAGGERRRLSLDNKNNDDAIVHEAAPRAHQQEEVGGRERRSEVPSPRLGQITFSVLIKSPTHKKQKGHASCCSGDLFFDLSPTAGSKLRSPHNNPLRAHFGPENTSRALIFFAGRLISAFVSDQR
jgi:hypothetical protein